MKKSLLISLLSCMMLYGYSQTPIGTIIGTTTYDLQTNNAGPKRLVQGSGGTLQAIWTGSTNLFGSWPDRGTFYNYYNGTAWGPQPVTRLESIRTGWPTGVITSGGKEIIMMHDPSIGAYNLRMLTRPVAGTGAWTLSNPNLDGIWPRLVLGGTNKTTLHLINADQNDVGSGSLYTQYFRSQDEGLTWDITQQVLPQMDTANGYAVGVQGADSYAIDVLGDTIAIVSAARNANDLALWKSTNNGTSWTRTIIMTHPIPNFDGNNFTDMDGDGDADSILVQDGSHEVLIDQSGLVHVWTGAMLIIDDDSTDGQWSYFPRTDGLFYWNENMGTDSVETITAVADLDGDSTLNGIGQSIAIYFKSLSSFPSAAIDTATGTIYLVYSSAVEFSDYFDDPSDAFAQSFRDLYGMYTTDGGATWSLPENLTNSADINNGSAHYESVFPSVARYADGQVHVMWQRDEEPGLNLQGDMDPITINDIVYHAFDYSDFEPGPPMAYFTSNKSSLCEGDSVLFISTTLGATSWSWSFPGGTPASSTLEKPWVIYPTVGNYNVTLIASNAIGPDTLIRTNYINVIVCPPPTSDFAANDTSICPGVTVLFTDLSTDASSYLWTFPGGVPASSTAPSPSVFYSNIGDYDVSLFVSNPFGSDTKLRTNYIKVQLCPPTVEFSANDTVVCKNQRVYLTNMSLNATSYVWLFPGGDPSSSTDGNPIVIYSSQGNYDITLTATNSAGSTALTKTNYIEVTNCDYPISDFSTTDTVICDSSFANFNSTSSFASSWQWFFSGGQPNSSSVENPSIFYKNEGTYYVTLIASNLYGSDTLTRTEYITVNKCPGIPNYFQQVFDIYPNPSSGYLEISLLRLGVVKIEVIDILGKLKLSEEYTLKKEGTKLKIDLDKYGLSEGIYLITVLDQDYGRHTRKFILKK